MSIFDRYDQFAGLTFYEAARQYLREFDGKCQERQEYALVAVMPYIGHVPLIDVDDLALQQYKKDRRQEVMAGTINKELATITAVLNKAARVWRYIPSAPKLQPVKGPVRQAYPITWAEQASLFSCMDDYLRTISIFAVNTGVRRSELFKLKWADAREVDGVRLFILRDTKNGHDRPVILNRLACRAVDSLHGLTLPHVFNPISVSKPFNRAWVKAGLPDDPLIRKGIHNLRHTFGHRLRAAGVGPEDRDCLLGHNSRSLTQHYARADFQRLGPLAELITKGRETTILR